MALFDDEGSFGTDPNGYARRRSSISAFSADGRGNFSRTESLGGMTAREEWGADYDDALSQRQVYDGMAQLGRRAAAVKRHNANLGNATILSAMKIAQQNGGRFPAYALDSAMRNFGMDGKSQAIGGMGYTSNGDFVIDMLSAGPNGGVTRTPRVIKPREQYQMMLGGGGAIFNQQDTMAFRQSLMDKHGYAGNELPVPDFSGVAMGAQVRQSQAKNAGLDKMIDTVVQSAMKEGRDPRWEAARALLTNKDFRAGIHGKQRVGEDGKPLMTTDDNGNEVPDYEPATDDDVMKSVDAYLEHYLGPRGGNGGQDDWQARLAAADALLEKYYGPRKLSPEEQEIAQRQRQNAVEDQRRADNMRGPQQLVRYTDANGRLVIGNGWIRDGKVYDANGYDVQGATPMTARYDAATGETRYEEMPRPEPAAEAQGSQGGAGRYGLRNDGKTYKGTGWLGELKLPNGGVATEYTIGVNFDGKEIDIPTLVPTLTKAQQELMVNDIIPNNKPVPNDIVKAAVDFAKMRLANGQSVFANDGQPPAHDGAALLQQMRGGGQPPAQGATQPAQGGAATQATQRATPQDVQRAVEERRRREAARQQQTQQAQGGAAQAAKATAATPVASVPQKPVESSAQPTIDDDDWADIQAAIDAVVNPDAELEKEIETLAPKEPGGTAQNGKTDSGRNAKLRKPVAKPATELTPAERRKRDYEEWQKGVDERNAAHWATIKNGLAKGGETAGRIAAWFMDKAWNALTSEPTEEEKKAIKKSMGIMKSMYPFGND